MAGIIHLHPLTESVPDIGSSQGAVPERLNLFPHRKLGEREFDLLQGYVDERLSALLSQYPAGILNGLNVSVVDLDTAPNIRIMPGLAIAQSGKPIALFEPINQNWAGLRPKQALADGYYFLTLLRAVIATDSSDSPDPCVRAEPDPLRDLRTETVTQLGLQHIDISKLPDHTALLKEKDPLAAANRLCVHFLQHSPFELTGSAVPVALIKVANAKLVWLNEAAGHYPAREDAVYRAFLAHTQEVFERYSNQYPQPPNSPLSLNQLLGVDFLPSAFWFPQSLLDNLGQIEMPTVNFDYLDLRVDLVPVPASVAPSIVEEEYRRSPISLANQNPNYKDPNQAQGDFMRLLLAIKDVDYTPTLMDLPVPELDLENQFYSTGHKALEDYNAFLQQYLELYAGLGLDNAEKDMLDGSVSYRSLFELLDFKAGDDSLLKSALQDEKQGQGLTGLPPYAPQFPDEFVNTHAADSGSQLLQALYQAVCNPPRDPGQIPEQYSNPPRPEQFDSEQSLYRKRANLKRRIAYLEQELSDNTSLLQDFDVFLKLQRQHMDSISISFANLAGGTAGDGRGLSVMQWLPHLDFKIKSAQ